MNFRILLKIAVCLFTFAIAGLAADPKKPDSPGPFQVFNIYAFSVDDAKTLWPTGAEAYATQEEAALDFPDQSVEAFFWSNAVEKDGALAALELVDADGDGFLVLKYVVRKHGHFAELFSDFDPLYFFIFGDKGR